MTRKKWTTKPQEEWLKKRNGQFAKAELDKECKSFYQDVLTAWLKQWPIPESTAAEINEAGSEEEAIKIKTESQEKVKSHLLA